MQRFKNICTILWQQLGKFVDGASVPVTIIGMLVVVMWAVYYIVDHLPIFWQQWTVFVLVGTYIALVIIEAIVRPVTRWCYRLWKAADPTRSNRGVTAIDDL